MNPKYSASTRHASKSNKPCRRSLWRSSLLTLSALALVSSYSAQAANLTWNGGGDGISWSTSNGSPFRGNWGGTQFATGDNVIFGGTAGLGPTIGVTALSAGSITFNNTAGAFTIGGSATLTISGGVLNNDNSLQSFSVTTITLGATQTWNAGTLSGGGLAFTGTTLNLGSSQSLTIDGTNNTSISNLTSGTGTSGITKNGTGVLTLSNANTYTGITFISSGTLVVNGNQSGATGAVSVASIAKLFGTGTIGGATTVLGTQSSGASAGAVGTQTFSSSLTYSTNSIFEWDIDVSGGTETHDKVVANSLLGSGAQFKILLGAGDTFADTFWDSNHNWNAADLFGGSNANVNLSNIFNSATTGTNFTANPLQGSFSFTSTGGGTGNQLTWTAVPEPTTALAGILLGAGLLRRRRQAA